MGRHATEESRRRGFAPWLVISVVVVVLFAAVTVVYLISANKRSTVSDCTSQAFLQVTTTPTAARAITSAAAAFDATKPIARSSCVTTKVTTMDGPATAQALIGGWKSSSTPGPAVWVADSVADVATVDGANAALTAGHSTVAIATSPVVLAVRTADRSAAAELTWKDLPAAAGGGDGGLHLSGGRALTIGWPDPATNRAGQAALQSVVAALSGDSQVTPAGVATAKTALGRLAASGAAGIPSSTDAALALLAGTDSPVSAVPALESEVAGYLMTSGSAGVAAVYPTGPTAGAEIMPVPITAGWVNDTDSAAAAAFGGFLNSAPGQQVLADSGLRVPGVKAAKALPGVTLDTSVATLPSAGGTVAAAVSTAFGSAAGPSNSPGSTTPTSGPSTPSGTPAVSPTSTGVAKTTGPGSATGPVVTFVVDTSSAMAAADGGQSLMTWTKSALTAAIALDPAASVGLWTVSAADGSTGFSQQVATGPLADGGRSSLTTTISALQPSGSCYLYGAIKAGYAYAASHVANGRRNLVVVITASSDATPSLSRDDLISAVKASAGSDVVLDVIGLAPAVNSAAMIQVAAAGHGTWASVDAADLQDTVASMITG